MATNGTGESPEDAKPAKEVKVKATAETKDAAKEAAQATIDKYTDNEIAKKNKELRDK